MGSGDGITATCTADGDWTATGSPCGEFAILFLLVRFVVLINRKSRARKGTFQLFRAAGVQERALLVSPVMT